MFRFIRLLPLLATLALLCCACRSERLSLFTSYVNHESLASYYVETPDPSLNYLAAGQRLFVRWNLPAEVLSQQPLTLQLQVRLRDRRELEQSIEICKRKGIHTLSVVGSEFFESGGILTYRARLYNGDGLLADEWRHRIWVDLISFPHDSEAENGCDEESQGDKGD